MLVYKRSEMGRTVRFRLFLMGPDEKPRTRFARASARFRRNCICALAVRWKTGLFVSWPLVASTNACVSEGSSRNSSFQERGRWNEQILFGIFIRHFHPAQPGHGALHKAGTQFPDIARRNCIAVRKRNFIISRDGLDPR